MKLKCLVIAALIILPFQPVWAKSQQIKLAILAPEGTTWMKTMHAFNRELQERTKGQLAFKIYSGGVSGDELDVIRKMRAGQMHAGGFTGVGLGQILSEIRVLELPFIFKNYEEVDHVTRALAPYFEQQFEKKGYVFLGFAEAGFVNVFSSNPLRIHGDFKSAKMWAWTGDPLVEELCKAYGIRPVPLSITDVLTSLQTGLINSFYAPPLAAIALQWFTKVSYMTSPSIANATGAMVMTKKFYDKIPESNQKILKEVSRKYSERIIRETRRDNQKSYETLKKNGIQFVDIPDSEIKKMVETGKAVQKALTGRLYSQELLHRVLGLIEARRKKTDS